MADDNRPTVVLRNPDTGEEITKPKSAARFFVNQGYAVLDSAGHVSGSATAALKKENN